MDIAPGLPTPEFVFLSPFVFEMMGAGFQRQSRKHVRLAVALCSTSADESATQHWELRWPRITKRYTRTQRAWEEAVDLELLDKLARQANSVDASLVDDEISGIWDDGLISSEGYAADRDAWEARLERADEEYASRSRPDPASTRSGAALTPRKAKSVPRLLSAPAGSVCRSRSDGVAAPQKPMTPAIFESGPSSPPPIPAVGPSHRRRASEDLRLSPSSSAPSKRRKGSVSRSLSPAQQLGLDLTRVVGPDSKMDDPPMQPTQPETQVEGLQLEDDQEEQQEVEDQRAEGQHAAGPRLHKEAKPPSAWLGFPWFTTSGQATPSTLSRDLRCRSIAGFVEACVANSGRPGLLFIDRDAELLGLVWRALIHGRGKNPLTVHVYVLDALDCPTPEAAEAKYMTCMEA